MAAATLLPNGRSPVDAASTLLVDELLIFLKQRSDVAIGNYSQSISGVWQVEGRTAAGRSVSERIQLQQLPGGELTGGHVKLNDSNADGGEGFRIHDGYVLRSQTAGQIKFTQSYLLHFASTHLERNSGSTFSRSRELRSIATTCHGEARFAVTCDRDQSPQDKMPGILAKDGAWCRYEDGEATIWTADLQNDNQMIGGKWEGAHINGTFTAVRQGDELQVDTHSGNAQGQKMHVGVQNLQKGSAVEIYQDPRKLSTGD
jgi:hypothetical protein